MDRQLHAQTEERTQAEKMKEKLEQELLKAKDLVKEDKTRTHRWLNPQEVVTLLRTSSKLLRVDKAEKAAVQAVDDASKLKASVDSLSADLEKRMEEAKNLALAKDNK